MQRRCLREQAEQQKQLLLRLKLATEAAGISIWDSDLKTGELVDDGSLWTLIRRTAFGPFNPKGSHPRE